jgi:UDP-galactopyranose mutase
MKVKYDYLLVGAGLFNAIFAREATRNGKKCLVVEKRAHLGGNLYCENKEGINVHKYGAHIFHTSNKGVWKYMSELCEFNHYVNSPLASYKGKIYNLPFNMNTFNQLWGISQPSEALAKIEKQKLKNISPQNFEEQALYFVGADIYHTFIKEYTEKQWGKNASELPAFIIKRIPLRFTFNNNYFMDPYQGIPRGGYNALFQECFKDCDVLLNTDFLENRSLAEDSKTVVYTGRIDQYFDCCFGVLEYRSLHFEDEILNMENYQGNAVVNYTEKKVPYTRIIEHKHFEFGEQPKTVITKEYPQEWNEGMEPYYPINTVQNDTLYNMYLDHSSRNKNLHFGGRLGSYLYCDMDVTVKNALDLYRKLN